MKTMAQRPAQAAPGDDGEAFVDDYLPALLAQASRLISNEFHRIVVEHGVSVADWRVLASLAGGRAMSIGGLASMSVTKQPTVTRMLDRLEAKGDVQRSADARDRRVTLVRITPQGQATVARLMELAKEHEHQVMEPFGLADAHRLKAMLRRMIEQRRGMEASDNDADAAPD